MGGRTETIAAVLLIVRDDGYTLYKGAVNMDESK